MGEGSELRIRRVAEIPAEKSGKYRYVVSRVPASVRR
jgi:phenylacetate-CoA ligase